MSIEGQGNFFTIYFPGFVCFVLYKAKISGECLQDPWSSGFIFAKISENDTVCRSIMDIFAPLKMVQKYTLRTSQSLYKMAH